MGFLAPAVPWIIKGGASLGASLLGKKIAGNAQTSAMKRSPEEQTDLTGATNAATSLGASGQNFLNAGKQTTQQGLDTLGGPTNYWQTLLGGNRAAMSQATAGSRGAISDIYSGASRNLERSGVRGAVRDTQQGELAREQAGKIAGLTTGVQPAAASALGDIGMGTAELGTRTASTGAEMKGASANIFSSLLGNANQNRLYGRSEGEKAGHGIGGFLFDAIKGIVGSKFGGSKIPTIGGTRSSAALGLGIGPSL